MTHVACTGIKLPCSMGWSQTGQRCTDSNLATVSGVYSTGGATSLAGSSSCLIRSRR